MSGETDLATMLRNMSPQLQAGEYVFCTFAGANYGDLASLQPVASFVEPEGLTLVVPRSKADEHGHDYPAVFRCITLMVHSSLEGVGLTAAVSTALASANVSANMIAGYFHDHLFVPVADANLAVQTLQALAAREV
jgi:hypothetical protein